MVGLVKRALMMPHSARAVPAPQVSDTATPHSKGAPDGPHGRTGARSRRSRGEPRDLAGHLAEERIDDQLTGRIDVVPVRQAGDEQ